MHAGTDPTRRDLLRLARMTGLAGLIGGGTAGCGLQMERDAPYLPLLPTAQPHPAEAILRRELATIRAAGAAAASYPPPARTRSLVIALRRVHGDQERVVQTRLLQLGPSRPPENTSAASNSSSTSSSASASPATGTPAAALARLLAAEGTGIGWPARTALADVPVSDRALVGALVAQRGVAWVLLGPAAAGVGLTTGVGAVPGPDGRSLLPEATWVPSADLAALLSPAAAAARYGAEVVAARAVPRQAQTARTGLAALADHASRLDQAARSAGRETDPELGYDLPFRVAGPADTARLARHVWTGWAQTVAAALAPASAADRSPEPTTTDSAAVTPPRASLVPTAADREQGHSEPGRTDAAALVGWLMEAELMRQRWSAPAAPFPGLRWSR